MKKVTDLKEGEVIHCNTEEQANAICKLMHEAGLKWCNGKSYLEMNEFYLYGERTCYEPASGTYCSIDFFKQKDYTIHEAEEFLEKDLLKETKEMENKEIIAYKLKEELESKEHIKQAIQAITDIRRFERLETYLEKEKWGGFKRRLAEAGVLDLWFEPVYKDKIKEGDYVIRTVETGGLFNKNRVFKVSNVNGYALEENLGITHSSESCRKATKKEIENHLIREAKKKGFEEGVIVDNSKLESIEWEQDEYPIKDNNFSYNSEDDRLKLGQKFIYEKGIWAEVVEKEKFEVGDVVVILENEENAIEDHVGEVTKVKEPADFTPSHCVNVEISYNYDGGLNVPKRYLRKATKEEIQEYYINLASKKGFKDGTLVKSVDNCQEKNLNFDYLTFYSHDNTEYLTDGHGLTIYENGKWAEIVEEEEFEVGDLVVVLPEDDFYYNAHGGDVSEIISIDVRCTTKLPYTVEFEDGDVNSYNKIRKATEDEIEEYKESKKSRLPKINGYQGEDVGDRLNYGCAYLPKSWFKSGGNRTITELTLSSGVKINEEQLIQIREYLNSKQND